MKYNFKTLLDFYDMPESGKVLFYEIVKDYAKKPDDIKLESYEEHLKMYYAYQNIWVECFLNNYGDEKYSIRYRDFVDEDTITTLNANDNFFEIGVKNIEGYYAKRLRNLGNVIEYDALYYDSDAVKKIKYGREFINSKLLGQKGLDPDKREMILYIASLKGFESEAIKNIHMLKDYRRIISEVKEALNEEKDKFIKIKRR